MKNSGKLVSFLVPIISILLAFVIGCIIMAVLGANPFVALESLWIGAFGSLRNVGTTLARSTPLIFTSLCACFAYRCGVFNLGGEGQFLMGSIVCCYIATQSGIEGLPAILLCLVGGAVAGGLWSLISGLLKVYRGQNEMIITIMLNYVATLFMGVVYTDWLRDGSVPQTQAVPEATQLSRLFGLRVTSAFVIALAVGLLVYYFLFYTSKGFQLRAVGLNMTAAEFNGFAVKKYILMSFIVSGAIAGLGGSAELLGTQFRLINGFGNGYGFRRRGHGPDRSAASSGDHCGGHLLRSSAGGLYHHAGGHRRAHQRIRHHPGPGDRVHRGGSGHGEAARIQGVPGKADGETEGGGLIWNLS